jgi:hypothetical protein
MRHGSSAGESGYHDSPKTLDISRVVVGYCGEEGSAVGPTNSVVLRRF